MLNVTVSWYKIGAARLSYLGRWAGGGHIYLHPLKMESMVNWPICQTKKQIQFFIGLANYYCRYVSGSVRLWLLSQASIKNQNPVKQHEKKGFDKVKMILSGKSIVTSPEIIGECRSGWVRFSAYNVPFHYARFFITLFLQRQTLVLSQSGWMILLPERDYGSFNIDSSSTQAHLLMDSQDFLFS